MNNLNYTDFINFVNSLSLQLLYIESDSEYQIFGISSSFAISSILLKDGGSNQIDFETNYKSTANKPIAPYVTTQFEKRDKTLKLAHGEASVQTDSTATISLKIPGIFGSGDGRWIYSGTAFFDIHNSGDKILSVVFKDNDNLLGYGAGFVVGSYTDDEMDVNNQGWVIPSIGSIRAEAIGGYGFAPSGFYIEIVGKKGGNITTGTFYANFEWAKTG